MILCIFKDGQMAENMMEIGKTIRWMAKECLLGKMEGNILETTLRISKKKYNF